MAEKTGNEIWDDMKNAQEALVDENLKKYKAEKDNLAAQADVNAAAESAGASADYQNYTTPNGNSIQADVVSRLGLNKGKLSETNQAGGYNAYQSRLAAAARQAQNAKEQLDLSYGIYGAQSQAEKSNSQANYNAMKNSEYWKKANWDYQLAADKKAEEEARRVQYSYNTVSQSIMPRVNEDGSTGTNWKKGEIGNSGSVLTTAAGARAAERIAMFKKEVLDQATLSTIINNAKAAGATDAELEYLIYLGGY